MERETELKVEKNLSLVFKFCIYHISTVSGRNPDMTEKVLTGTLSLNSIN